MDIVNQNIELFKKIFIENAPLYAESEKYIIPANAITDYISLPESSTMLEKQSRILEEIAAYETFVNLPDGTRKPKIEDITENLARKAGILIDGFLMMQRNNFKGAVSIPDKRRYVATDIFNSSNFQFLTIDSCGPSLQDPSSLIGGWIAYRFKFACAYL